MRAGLGRLRHGPARPPAPAGRAARSLPTRLARAALIVAAAVVAVAGLQVRTGFYADQIAQAATLALLAVSVDIVWGHGGVVSLGQTVPFGFAAYLTARLTMEAPAMTVPIILLAALSGAAVGLLMGIVLLRRRRAAMTIALFTMMLSLLAERLAAKLQIIGGFNGLAGVPPFHLGPLELSSPARDLLIVGTCAATVVGAWSLSRRPVGGVLLGVRDCEPRMAASGYHTIAVKVAAMATAGAVAGIGGALYAVQTGFVYPGVFGFGFIANTLLWTLIGGFGTLVGPVAATAGLTLLEEYLASEAIEYWLLLTGLAFLVLVMFVEGGIAMQVRRWLGRGLRTPNQVELAPSEQGRPASSRLRAVSLSSSFGAFRALSDVDLDVAEPGVYCLIGPNGAGKTTLLDALCGFQRTTSGGVEFDGTDLTHQRPWTFARMGVARKFQTPHVMGSLTVAENVALAAFANGEQPGWMWSRTWHAEVPPEAMEALASAGLDQRLDAPAGDLSHGEQQWLETVLALCTRPRILLLDEPTAGLTATESGLAARQLRAIAGSHRIPLIVVEHDTTFIREASDHVTVLAGGRVIARGTVEEIEADPRVKDLYFAQ